MSAQETEAAVAAPQSQHLEQEAAALASDILPLFTSEASIESIWSSERIAFINERRSIVQGQKIFFDELLTFASVDASMYPPRSEGQLSSLLKAIFGATTLDYLKQLSLVYYLLLDLDAYTQHIANDQGSGGAAPSASAAEQFADNFVVLPQFTDAMQGYWLLDNDQYEQAVPLLAVADFIPKIVRTLYLPSANEKRSDVARAKLLIRFLRTSNQVTSSPSGSEPFLQEVEMQIQALCFVSGPARAFSEIRALTSSIQDDEQRRVSIRARLIFKVLEHCFAPPRSAAIQNLLACSLDPEEEVTLESFVLSPPAAMTATWSYAAADVLIIRYISQGRYMDAVGLDRRLGPDVSQGHSTAKDAQQRSKMMEQRKRMIAGARGILPEVQKELLRIEESAEISGGVDADSVGKEQGANGGGVNGKVAVNDFADRSGLVHTPLSASPAARRINHQTPTTQAAILSAVVRASASPSAPSTPSKAAVLGTASPASVRSGSGTPVRAGLTPQNNPAAMIGFLAKNALSGQRSTPDAESQTDSTHAAAQDESMQDDLEEMDGSTVLVSKRSAAAKPSAPASPWRNQPSLTSSSPFSGFPKLTRPAFPSSATAGGAASIASGSRSPYASSPRGAFQPATTSPFASSSMRSSPSLSSSTSARGGKLSGAIGLVSQHGRKSRLGREEQSFDAMEDSDAEEQTRDDAEDLGDDTFVQTQSKSKNGDVSIGRLVPGRRGWKETQEEPESEMQEVLNEPQTKRRTRKAASPTKKMTRSRTGVNLASSSTNNNADQGSGLTKSRSKVSLSGKRATRSTSAANRKPLTLSNLEQHSKEDVGSDAAPIARRTRAATAEQGSVAGSQAQGGGASTIYTISEVGGDDDVPTKSPVKRRTRRTAAGGKGSVRRSSRISSVEPETGGGVPEMSEVNSLAKRRGGAGGRRTKMPGGLE
ncbi:uncharacterized protein UHOD_02031 [Ustilago sp. UG-2017b]|nr:uncharacterized protein UHOD_02031 [Ustilago sp. UG-2017b]